MLYIVLIGLTLFNSGVLACEQSFTIQVVESSKDRLIQQLLDLSLSKNTKAFCTKPLTSVLTDGREEMLVRKDFLDIIWSSAIPTENTELKAIRIPIFKGLTGYRILVIRQGEQGRFDSVQQLSELKNLLAGQGAFWGDTQILRQAGMSVVTSTRGRNLWQMLHKKRFDFMPLGMHEPWKDLAIRSDLNLIVEKNILLKYPFALFFYVNKKNNALFDYISSGMKAAIKDKSYNLLLRRSEMIRDMSRYANIQNRRVIVLANPDFHQHTPKENIQYWLTPEELLKFMNKAN